MSVLPNRRKGLYLRYCLDCRLLASPGTEQEGAMGPRSSRYTVLARRRPSWTGSIMASIHRSPRRAGLLCAVLRDWWCVMGLRGLSSRQPGLFVLGGRTILRPTRWLLAVFQVARPNRLSLCQQQQRRQHSRPGKTLHCRSISRTQITWSSGLSVSWGWKCHLCVACGSIWSHMHPRSRTALIPPTRKSEASSPGDFTMAPWVDWLGWLDWLDWATRQSRLQVMSAGCLT